MTNQTCHNRRRSKEKRNWIINNKIKISSEEYVVCKIRFRTQPCKSNFRPHTSPVDTEHKQSYTRSTFTCVSTYLCLFLRDRWSYVRFEASLVAQTVKRLPAMQETRVRFLVREEPLEKEMAIHSSTLAWKIPWMEEPDRLQCMGSQRVGHDWVTSLQIYF